MSTLFWTTWVEGLSRYTRYTLTATNRTIRNAHDCSSDDNDTTITCQMLLAWVDSDGDGRKDTYFPDKPHKEKFQRYSGGNYVWYYDAGATGIYGLGGSGNVWRSECTGSSNPTIFDIDVTFSHYFWTMAYQKRRYPWSTICTSQSTIQIGSSPSP